MTRILTIIALWFATPLLASCAGSDPRGGINWRTNTTATSYKDGNGVEWWRINCNSFPANCYKRANLICSNGFIEAGKESQRVGASTMYGTVISTHSIMTVSCK